MTIEPVVACYMTAFTLITLTVSNLNLQKACKVNLRLASDTCEALVTKGAGSSAADEVAVQRLVAGMMMWQTCAQNVLPCLVMLLVGSWSDRTRKRVPCMLLPLYGELVRNAGQLLCVYFFDQLPMEAAGIAESIPLAVTGGQTLLTMTAYSYMGDATLVSVDDRWRFLRSHKMRRRAKIFYVHLQFAYVSRSFFPVARYMRSNFKFYKCHTYHGGVT
jgi:PCFT/HCP family folate transporter-like MFS transporter 1/3